MGTQYRIPPLKKNFRLLEDLNEDLSKGCVFYIKSIEISLFKKVKESIYLIFPVKDNKETPIKNICSYSGRPAAKYINLNIEEFNELMFEEVNDGI